MASSALNTFSKPVSRCEANERTVKTIKLVDKRDFTQISAQPKSGFAKDKVKVMIKCLLLVKNGSGQRILAAWLSSVHAQGNTPV